MDPDHVWTHLTDAQADGTACVMCGRSTVEAGWRGVVIGRSPEGSPVYACSDGEPSTEDPWTVARASGSRPGRRTCADQACAVAPDSPEGLWP